MSTERYLAYKKSGNKTIYIKRLPAEMETIRLIAKAMTELGCTVNIVNALPENVKARDAKKILEQIAEKIKARVKRYKKTYPGITKALKVLKIPTLEAEPEAPATDPADEIIKIDQEDLPTEALGGTADISEISDLLKAELEKTSTENDDTGVISDEEAFGTTGDEDKTADEVLGITVDGNTAANEVPEVIEPDTTEEPKEDD